MKIISITFATMLACFSFSASAQEEADVANVLSVTPIVTQVAVNTQECTVRPMMQQEANTGFGVGSLLGAIAGAAVGNQVGGGNGKTVATVLGGLGGLMLGTNAQNAPQQPVQDCQTITRYEPRVLGYQVVYAFAGRQRVTQMPRDPGSSIKVQVMPAMM